MTNMVSWDSSIRVFLQQAGSPAPTPGGGSVAALIAALGASMATMVGNLSQGGKYAPIQPQIVEVIEMMASLTTECEELHHADITCFNYYMEALKLPKVTDEEALIRNQAIHEAAIHAIDVPLRLIEVCKAGIICTHRIAESSNKNVISDLGIGAILFEAAAQSASLTVEINLNSLQDLLLKRQYASKLSLWISEIENLKNETLQIARNRIMHGDATT
ncbi:cyclodeaminase/cyclohydrolase family protein [Paenibacillus sp. MMS18-CY102]|uniref:cyclodeaminase/cyclohydrolase family protein n=1 Tax=Paenibacillus sp. MMS18-CY102 TaxID=2682849 RepID=UPI00136579E7|nr:cyclodeaminase/cyclohydrolase family protein [Paenibacillus sp. MMS18-CY102]MWC27666.1 methenyltetrahydrofolate cyclohydrolase [Paenibacillus sp. MMS18-CY102]